MCSIMYCTGKDKDMPTEVGDRAKRNHILAYIEKHYPGCPVKEVSADCSKVTTDTEIVSVLADAFGKITVKTRKRRGQTNTTATPKAEIKKEPQEPTKKKRAKDTPKEIQSKSQAVNPLFSNADELKKHLSCDFLPGDKVKVRGNSEDVYEVDSLSLTQSGLEYMITKNHSDRRTVANGDLEKA